MTLKKNKRLQRCTVTLGSFVRIIYFLFTFVACMLSINISALNNVFITAGSESLALPNYPGYTKSQPCESCVSGNVIKTMQVPIEDCLAGCNNTIGCQVVTSALPAFHCVLIQNCSGFIQDQNCNYFSSALGPGTGYVSFTNNNPKAFGSCNSDVDCQGGKVCRNGSCVRICDPNSTRPIASGGECWGCNDGNGSCPAGTTCQGDGSCVAAPPPPALTCSNGGPACSNPAPVCNNGTCGACTSDAQCPFGQICEKGSCIAPYCTSNAQCSNPTPICETGRCRACHTDSECPANQKCNTGTGSCEAKKLTLCP